MNASPTPFHAVANAVTSKSVDPTHLPPHPDLGPCSPACQLGPPWCCATQPSHVVDAAADQHPARTAELEHAGFTRLEETKSWPELLKPGGKYYVTRNQSSIIAFSVPPKLDKSKPTGISIVG